MLAHGLELLIEAGTAALAVPAFTRLHPRVDPSSL